MNTFHPGPVCNMVCMHLRSSLQRLDSSQSIHSLAWSRCIVVSEKTIKDDCEGGEEKKERGEKVEGNGAPERK